MKTDNTQQLLYIGTLFGTFNARTQKISVKDKQDTTMTFELYPSYNRVAYRIIFNDNSDSLWGTWESIEDVENYFKIASLL